MQQLIKSLGGGNSGDQSQKITDLTTKVDKILEILNLTNRDTGLKFDEQKKRFDSISEVLAKQFVAKLQQKRLKTL